MGLDIGDKTIGVAVSDPLGFTAQGIATIARKGNQKQEAAELLTIISQYEVNQIIVGLPKNMDGSIGPQAHKVINYAEKLKQVLKLPVILWDERMSTLTANRTLLEADISRKGRRKVIDKLAAVVILQSFLDRKP